MKRLIVVLFSITAVTLGIFILGSYIKMQRMQTAYMSAALIGCLTGTVNGMVRRRKWSR